MKLTERFILLAFILAGVAYGIYWCINSGPCGHVCDYIPSTLQSLLGLCNGPGNGGGQASSSTLADFNNILTKLESQTGTPGCSGSDCIPDAPGQSSGMLSVGGS